MISTDYALLKSKSIKISEISIVYLLIGDIACIMLLLLLFVNELLYDKSVISFVFVDYANENIFG